MKTLFAACCFIFFIHSLFAADSTKVYNAVRASHPPKIDGVLDDDAWKSAEITSSFTQNFPTEGAAPTYLTEVRLVYDNNALYVAAMMHDPSPDSILHELGNRDDYNLNADNFRFVFDPYNTRQDAYDFGVWASGVQADYKFSDNTYDAVWSSAVKINDKGWVVEMKIPYSAIRFPKKEVQEWGLQFTRNIRRTREFDQWALTPSGVGNSLVYWGTLKGMTNIEAPVRLSLTPYVSGYFERSPDVVSNGSLHYANSTSYNFGADLKYGIDERFTLDMTLLPDFGQVQSDKKVKNLSYRETVYDENRGFFKESTELFNKNRLFYSRRIGKTPSGFYSLQYEIDPSETIVENPSEVKLLNAFKVSGRNNNGLGIGFFNAVTDNAYAVVKNSDGDKRKILTEPLTNYNIIVFDQQLKNNSKVSLINTNVVRDKGFNDANVTSVGYILQDKKNKFMSDGAFAWSQIFVKDTSEKNTFSNTLGHKYYIGFYKISGMWQYGISRSQIDNTFRSSDLGYQAINNEVWNNANLSHNLYKPWKFIRQSFNNLNFNYATHYLTGKRSFTEINLNLYALLQNYNSYFGGGGISPMRNYDYNEPRTNDDRYFRSLRYFYFFVGTSTDYRKKLALDFNLNMSNFIDEFLSEGYNTSVGLRYRVSDKFTVRGQFNYSFDPYNIGFATFDSVGEPVFGARYMNTYDNSLTLKYIFKNDLSLSIAGRHYWSSARYRHHFDLEENGELTEISYPENLDFSYNAFNIDALFEWQFAPGSLLSFAYKNIIESDEFAIPAIPEFKDNFTKIFDRPQSNTISLKAVYYLDYLYLKKKKS